MKREASDILQSIQLICCRRKLLCSEVSDALGVRESELFYQWINQSIPQQSSLGQDLFFTFHGLDCSVRKKSTGDRCRIEFGPGGVVDSFTATGLRDELSDFDLAHLQSELAQLEIQGSIKFVDPNLRKAVQDAQAKGTIRELMLGYDKNRQMDTMICDRMMVVSK